LHRHDGLPDRPGALAQLAHLAAGWDLRPHLGDIACPTLVLAMGDPLSICSDPTRAAREMHRITKPGGVLIATADNKLAARGPA
jgi:SAM-dependent methyltransferase